MSRLKHGSQAPLSFSKQVGPHSHDPGRVDQVLDSGAGEVEISGTSLDEALRREFAALLNRSTPASDLREIPNPTWHYRDRHGR